MSLWEVVGKVIIWCEWQWERGREEETKERKGKWKHSWFKKPNHDLLSLTPDRMKVRGQGQLHNIRTNMSQIVDAVILTPKWTFIVIINCDLVIFIGT